MLRHGVKGSKVKVMHGYEKGHDRTLLEKCSASVEMHVGRTALCFLLVVECM